MFFLRWSPFCSWVNPLLMAIFNSYVKLPEGIILAGLIIDGLIDHWRFVWINCWVNPAPVEKWLVGWMFSSSHSGPSNGSRNPFVTWVLLQGLLYLGGDAESIRKPCPKDLMVTLVTVASRIWGWRKVKSSTNGSFSIAMCHYQRATARFGFLTCLLIHHD